MTLLALITGYCAAVIFPIPGVSRAILDAWAWAWLKIREK